MIICIGREFGSGGHEIGSLLAEKLQVPLYDQELIDAAVLRCGKMDAKEMEKADEKKANPWFHRVWYDTVDKDLRGLSTNDVIFRIQSDTVLELAGKGDCIFVGRCADYILKQAGMKRLSLFITAPFGDRVRRKMDLTGRSEKEITSLVRKMDKQRKNYYNYYTGGSWGKAANYDFCINSYAGDMEYSAKLLYELVSKIG